MTNEAPRTAISNGIVDVEVYVPDADHGFIAVRASTGQESSAL